MHNGKECTCNNGSQAKKYNLKSGAILGATSKEVKQEAASKPTAQPTQQKPTTMVKDGKTASMCAMMYNHFPNSISLTATVVDGGGVNKLRFKDSCGLFDDLSIGTGATTQEMSVVGSVSADSVRKWLQTYCGRISLINYDSSAPAQLNNRINIIAAQIDTTQQVVKTIDVSIDRRNTQFNDELQTVRPHEGSAWMCTNTGFVIDHILANASTGDITTSLAIQFDRWVSYTDLYTKEC